MKKVHFWFSLAILLAATIMIVFDSPGRVILRNISFDTFQRLQPREYKEAPVRIIDIDEESLRRYGQWPWPRTLLADLTKRLTGLGAAMITFDMVFAEPDRMSPRSLIKYWSGDRDLVRGLSRYPDNDEIFSRSIRQGRVVVGFSSSLQPVPQNKQPAIKARIITAGDDPRQFMFPFPGAVKNLSIIEAEAAGNGAFNYLTDRDGVIRHIPLVIRINDTIYPALSSEALRVAQGAQNIVIKSSGASGENRFGGHTGIVGIRVGSLQVETDPKGEIWLHYSDSYPKRYIPAWKILSGQADPSLIAGHILFVGTSAKGLLDLKITPLGSAVPGVEIHAQLVEQLIHKTYLFYPDWSAAATILFLFAGWLVINLLVSRSNAVALAAIAVLGIGLTVGGSWLAFTRAKAFIDPLFPSIVLVAICVSCSFFRFMETERERRWIRNAFSSYVSPNLVEHLLNHPELLKLGGEKRECSFILTDLDGFTTIVEKLDPEQVVNILNTYIDEMLKIAFDYDATVDRIVGDSIALMFSAPVVQKDHAQRAVACAVALHGYARKFAEDLNRQGIPLGGTRIGVHTGNVIVGNFGSKTMLDYRALGDPINTCSRLETVNKYLGTWICVSRETADKCPGFIGRPVGTLLLMGKSQGIEAFEPLSREEMDSQGIQAYLAAYRMMEQLDPGARDAFAGVVKEYTSDRLARFHLDRLEQGASGNFVVMDKK